MNGYVVRAYMYIWRCRLLFLNISFRNLTEPARPPAMSPRRKCSLSSSMASSLVILSRDKFTFHPLRMIKCASKSNTFLFPLPSVCYVIYIISYLINVQIHTDSILSYLIISRLLVMFEQ